MNNFESINEKIKRQVAATTIRRGKPNWTDSEGRPPAGLRAGMAEIKRSYRSGKQAEPCIRRCNNDNLTPPKNSSPKEKLLLHDSIKRISLSRGIHKILFVCLGNICRSPMAEYLLRDRLKSNGNRDIQISSAGFLDQTGARSPKEIHIVMNEAGIDISEHRSSPISMEKFSELDLIIVMEIQQKEELVRQYPEEASRIFLLSQFDKQNPEERTVSDPMGQTLSFYKNCFNDIRRLVEGLTEYILKVN